MKRLILLIFITLLIFSSDGCSNNQLKDNLTGEQTKSFGTYTIPKKWVEYPELSNENKYFYIKDGTNIDKPTSNISVECGENRYAESDHLLFKEAILRQLSMQLSKQPGEFTLNGSGSNTKSGYVLYIFTIEEKTRNVTTKQYYIVGNYKYVLVIETDFHDENIPNIDDISRKIVDSFKWSE